MIHVGLIVKQGKCMRVFFSLNFISFRAAQSDGSDEKIMKCYVTILDSTLVGLLLGRRPFKIVDDLLV